MQTTEQTNWVPLPDLKAILFPGELQNLAQGKCPFCGRIPGDFKDVLSKREFEISGLCQQCQDETFGASEPEVEDDPYDESLSCGCCACCGCSCPCSQCGKEGYYCSCSREL